MLKQDIREEYSHTMAPQGGVMSKPRIYIITRTFLPPPGGTEKQALMHGRSLQERGFVTTIVTLRHNRNWLAHEVFEGVPVIRVAGTVLGGRERLPGPLRSLLYVIGLLILCWTLWRHRRRYDILHLYHLGLEALPVAFLCRLTGKPLIISVRCVDSGRGATLPGKLSLLAGPLDPDTPWLQVDERNRLEGDLATLELLGKPVVRFTRSLLQRIHSVVVILSPSMKDYLVAHDFDLPGTQLIPNGVDIMHFHPNRTDISTPPLIQQDKRAAVVVCVAGLRYEKGIDVLLQAWYLVHKQAPEARLILVGKGPLQSQLERLAQALDIRESVEFAGLQSDVRAHLYRGGLAVLPSRYEGMPNALLEAMACGLPCVATRTSGSKDIIQHGVNGLLVEPEDYQAMAQALLTLLRDPVLARNCGRAARTTVEKHYSLSAVTDTYVELYQRIADRGRRMADVTSSSEISRLPL
jgi:glycosyltransferase involved in cell wall biosynthesis